MSPKSKLNIVFWTITIPVIPFVTFLLLIAMIVFPIPGIGNHMMHWIEKTVTKFAIWRNNLPVVKNAYDKAHLFEYIKGEQ
jgi:hypothetical protein